MWVQRELPLPAPTHSSGQASMSLGFRLLRCSLSADFSCGQCGSGERGGARKTGTPRQGLAWMPEPSPRGAEVEQPELEALEVGDPQPGRAPPTAPRRSVTRERAQCSQALGMFLPLQVIACGISLDHLFVFFSPFSAEETKQMERPHGGVLLLLAASGSRQHVASCLASKDGWKRLRRLRAHRG